MRAVVQRVLDAYVDVAGERKAQISKGFLVLLGVEVGDTSKDALWLAEKIVKLRVFEDENDKMNLSIKDVAGEIIAVSQFTLLADCRKGNRPGFSAAAPPEQAEQRYEEFVQFCRKEVNVKTGCFQTEMFVGLVNHGPVTILLDSRKLF